MRTVWPKSISQSISLFTLRSKVETVWRDSCRSDGFHFAGAKKKKNGAPASKVQYLKGKRLHVEVINHCTDMKSSNIGRTFSVEIFIFYFHYLMIVLLGKKDVQPFFSLMDSVYLLGHFTSKCYCSQINSKCHFKHFISRLILVSVQIREHLDVRRLCHRIFSLFFF